MTIPRLTSEQRGDLVAYLDGELDDVQTQAIDQVLATSEIARREVESLARSWELLDILPRPKASEDFTAKTLATIKVQEAPRPLTIDRRWSERARRGVVLAAWAAGLAAASAFGYLATNRWIPNEAELLLRDEPVIERLHKYEEVESIEFLRELQKSGLFNEAVDQTKR